MELYGALSREAYSPGDVIEAVVHLASGCAAEQSGALTCDWLAARAHGEWRLPPDPASSAHAPPALVGSAPGVIACDVRVQPLSALSYVVHIPLPCGLPPSYRSAVPARAGARERSPAARLNYGVHLQAQRRADGCVLTAALVLPFEVLPAAAAAPDRAPGVAGAWRWPTPAEIAAGAAVPHIPTALPLFSCDAPAADAPDSAARSAIAAAAPVRVELQVCGAALGSVLLPEGSCVNDDGSRPVSLVLYLDEASPLLCVAACAKLQAVETFVGDAQPHGSRRVVTVGECDAHTEHATMVTLAVHLPVSAPPALPAGSPVSCSWQLELQLAVRARAEPLAPCSRVSWAHPLVAALRARAARPGSQLGVSASVRF